MPIPGLTPAGVLPPGIHDCTLAEIKQVFAPRGSTAHRRDIYDALLSCFGELQLADFVEHALVDGSFVTRKLDPRDVDVVFGLRAGALGRLSTAMQTSGWPLMFVALLNGRTTPIVGGCHLVHGFPVPIGSLPYQLLLAQFQHERDGVTIKGILRVRVQ
jgi:hypothetical protein